MASVSDELASGWRLHQSGRLEQAEQSYRRAVEAAPRTAAAWCLLGMVRYDRGRLDEAVAAYRESLRLDPACLETHNNLGNALLRMERLEEAAGSFRRAIEIEPHFACAYNGLGAALLKQERPAEALPILRRAVELQPDYAEAHNSLGNALRELKNFDEAVACYRQALHLAPQSADTHYNLGIALREQEKPAEAMACFRRALELRPVFAEAEINLGNALKDQGKPQEAMACYQRAVRGNPDSAEAHYNLGIALREQGQASDAVACYRRALEIRPAYPEAHNNLGNALKALGRLDEAAACYQRAIEIAAGRGERTEGNAANAYNGLGAVLMEQGKFAECGQSFEKAIRLKSDLPDAHLNQSLLCLLRGEFQQGWPGYEWRWKTKGRAPRPLPQPLWDGRPLAGQSILLHAEQGLGDTIQFIRYAPLVNSRGGRVIVECQKPLLRLLARSPGIDQFVGQGDPLPPFATHAPLLSLPGIFNTCLESIPGDVPYVFADPALVQRWRERLGHVDGFKIGIGWQGNAQYPGDQQRSMPLARFAPLAAVPGVRLVNLQKGPGKEQIEQVRGRFEVLDLGNDLDEAAGAFMDTAAVMKNMDLIVTSDTAVAHLAGALGVHTWLALPLVPDWRWLLDREDSPWYPMMRLFRQKQSGDWPEVFARMEAALHLRLGGVDAGRVGQGRGTIGGTLQTGQPLMDDGTVALERPATAAPPDSRFARPTLHAPPPPGLAQAMAAAWSQYQARDLEGAERAYRQVVETAPSEANAWCLLGMVCYDRGRLPEAVAAYRQSLQCNPGMRETHNNLGNALLNLQQYEEAAESFRRAVAIDANFACAWNGLGAALGKLNQTEEAIAAYERALDIRPDYAEALANLTAAWEHRGKLSQTEADQQRTWQRQREFAPAHCGLGNVLQRHGELKAAGACFRRAVRVQPTFAGAYNNLGNVLLEQGKLDEAAGCFERATQVKPDYAGAYYNLGNVLRSQKKLDEALARYRRAIELQPAYVDAHNNLAATLQDLGKLDEAVECFRRALTIKPDSPEAHHNLGVALHAQQKLDEAVECYARAIHIKPDFAGAHFNLGNVLRDQKKLDEAVASYRRALEIKPDYVEVLNNLGNIWKEQGKLDDAADCYRRAIALRAEYYEAYHNLGKALRDQGKLDDAAECYRQAVDVKPDYVEAYNNLGALLMEQGKIEECMTYLQRAVRLKPDLADAHLNRSLLWLLMGDFPQGWPEYEWRWKTKQTCPRQFPQPPWDGGPLEGKTILIHGEQGLGDNIQFLRYAPLVKARGARVIVECHKVLLPLLANARGADQMVKRGDPLPPFDVHVPMMTLPGIFGTTVDNIPADVPYVFADPALVQRWRERLAQVPGFKIGINWQGNPQYRVDQQRSMPLAQFAPLAAVPGVRLVNLQKGAGKEQIEQVRDRFEVVDLGNDLDEAAGAFMDTAAVMTCVDLVVTSDTAAAHLAGALGVRVWLALPLVPDWRWFLDRPDSPWYPTMRLFRQSKFGEWPEVFARMEAALRAEIS